MEKRFLEIFINGTKKNDISKSSSSKGKRKSRTKSKPNDEIQDELAPSIVEKEELESSQEIKDHQEEKNPIIVNSENK